MPRKAGLIKTYGRHKFRTVKADLWVSPEDVFCSPVSKKERKSVKPKSTATTFEQPSTWRKPASAYNNTVGVRSGWNVLPSKWPPLASTKEKENISFDSFDDVPPYHKGKTSTNSTTLSDRDTNMLDVSEGNSSSCKSNHNSINIVNESDMSEDISSHISSACTSVTYLSSESDHSKHKNSVTEKSYPEIIPESPDIVFIEKKSSSLSTNDSIRSCKSFEKKSLVSFYREKKDIQQCREDSPVLLYPQLHLCDISANNSEEPHATSTPVIRANSRNTQLVTQRGRRKATAAKPAKRSDSLSECKVLLEPLKITPIQFEAARILSEASLKSLSFKSDLEGSGIEVQETSRPTASTPAIPFSKSDFKRSSYADTLFRQSDIAINLSYSSHQEASSLYQSSTVSNTSSAHQKSLNNSRGSINKSASRSQRRTSASSTSSYTGSLMDCVVSLERLELSSTGDSLRQSQLSHRSSVGSNASSMALAAEESVGQGRLSHRSSVGSDVTSVSDSSLPPKTPPKKQASHMSFLEALTPAGEKEVNAEKEEEVQLSIHNMTPYQKLLLECEQDEPMTFKEYLKPSLLNKCSKIGEGVYGEVFKAVNAYRQSVAVKIIPINGDFPVNGEPQKSYEEIMPEIVISKELSALNHCSQEVEEMEENSTPNFVEVYRVSLIQDRYPASLLREWDKWDRKHQSENDRPDIFQSDQYFIVFEFANGGQDLEHFQFKSLSEALSVLHQTTLSLAAAESALEFEHRDLHWGNVLIARGREQLLTYCVNGETFCVNSHGVCVSIIDFTLSRLRKDGVTVFCDLSEDETMFTGRGDYQFDVYRKMRKHNRDEWETFNPFSNVLWVHYLADKILKSKDYAERDRSLDTGLKRALRQIQRSQSTQELVHEGLFALE